MLGIIRKLNIIIHFKIISLILFLTFNNLNLYAERIENDFDLKLSLQDSTTLFIRVSPLADRMITGLSAENPFITIEALDTQFSGNGLIFQSEYLSFNSPGEYKLNFIPAASNLTITVNLNYVACSVTKELCEPPRQVTKTFKLNLEDEKTGLGLNQIILLASLFVGIISLLLFICYKKEAFKSLAFLFFFGYTVFYSTTTKNLNNLTQAEYSRQIAESLCLSCIGFEDSEQDSKNSWQTQIPLKITKTAQLIMFSAPWCKSCIKAKEFLTSIYEKYPAYISLKIADLSTEEGIEILAQLSPSYNFMKPLPLPALVVLTKPGIVLYGMQEIESKLSELLD